MRWREIGTRGEQLVLLWVCSDPLWFQRLLSLQRATAKHFVLDAIGGAAVCGCAWWGNGVMINLCALEDWLLWYVRICKPEAEVEVKEGNVGPGVGWEYWVSNGDVVGSIWVLEGVGVGS